MPSKIVVRRRSVEISSMDTVQQIKRFNNYSLARIKLYNEVDKLRRSVLYHDTNSNIYASDGTNDLPLGNFLGEFTDELDGDSIPSFISDGPKNYGYQTKGEKTCYKIRLFTLNFRNSEKLNFESGKALVFSLDYESKIPLHNPAKITREAKRRKIINKEETKLYTTVYEKRVIQDYFANLPHG
ncbi:hypothetical protein AVEN_19647-1 [Araneus ventricosus]|uniref:Uncharacterized protein n=1 Tax=Araneus ventricosus TaxID=182803 RepID=A0A4Y2C489_ARAVE|nr:hypothetical protein AVEN_19647-1 [Araneus ventricosus]